MFSCVVGRDEYCKQISLACVGSAHSIWTTLGLPQLKVARASWVYTAQTPGCSAGALSKVGPEFCELPRFKLLRFRFSGSPQRHRQLGMSFVPFLGPSSSGDQVAGERTLPSWAVHLITSRITAAWFPGCTAGAPTQVCCVSLLGR